MDDTPLDFSLKKRTSPSPPPPYRYSNPLRQHSPPSARTVAVSPPRLHQSTAPPYVFPVFNLPPYPRSPSPPSPAARPPPPSYEADMAAKPKSPTLCRRIPTTNPTFLTLTSRPIPSAFPISPPLQIKQEVGLRPVIPSVPQVPVYRHNDLGSENKENKEKEVRKITIVEGSCFYHIFDKFFKNHYSPISHSSNFLNSFFLYLSFLQFLNSFFLNLSSLQFI